MLKKMHAWIETRLQGSNEEPVAGQVRSLQLAAAVLMLEVARSDFEHDPSEQVQISLALKKAFALDDEDIEELLRFAGDAVKDTVSLHAYIRELNEEFTHAEKVELVQQLWRVAYADGRIDKYEDYTIRKLSDLLYVSHRDFILEKHKAEKAVLGES